MIRFSANLGFLWQERSLPDAIRAAKRHGFDAVECHWPFDTPATDVAQALAETELSMIGLNTRRGAANENGLAALPGREEEARLAIDEAIAYASVIGANNVHVMAGATNEPEAHNIFIRNLHYACRAAEPHRITILIEPLNRYDAPGYFLASSTVAKEIIEEVGATNLKLMFDCYHLQRLEGDLIRRLSNLMPIIGHIQFASVPDRAEPDHGEVDYPAIFQAIEKLGYDKPLGAEYRPRASTESGLSWMRFRTV